MDTEAEGKIKTALSAAATTEADAFGVALLTAYRINISRREIAKMAGDLPPEQAEQWAARLKTCRDELDLSLTGAVALQKSKCVDAAK